MAVKRVRHQTSKNETLITTYGEAQLDEGGHITNMDKLTGTPDQILAHCPGFVDADIFPAPVPSRPKDQPAPKAADSGDKKEAQPDAGDAIIADIIKELLAAGTQVTSEGYIDMAPLLEALRAKSIPAITGTKRKEITDAFNLPKPQAK